MANYDFSREEGKSLDTVNSTEYPKFTSEAHPSCEPEIEYPFLHIPNIHNFRAIGIHEFPDTKKRVRPDFIYRSAEPSPITAEGIEALQKLGITTIYDLRSLSEIERNRTSTPVVEIPGTTRVFAPVFGPASPNDHHRRMQYYGEEGTQGFVKAYEEICATGADAYRTVLTHIRDRPTEPILIHCTAGKDRTGILVALILMLAGVSDNDIGDEYALTELGLAKWAPRIVQILMKDPALEGDEEKATRMISAKKANMEAFLSRLRDLYGSAEGYLKFVLGFPDEDIAKIKENIVEPLK